EQGALPRLAVVGHLGVLVHAASNPVADQRAYDREAGALGDALDRARDVSHAVPGAALGDAGVQGLLGRAQQVLGLLADLIDRERPPGVVDPAVECLTDVHGADVTALEPVGAGDPVDDHRVGRGADRAGKAAIALEGGDRAPRADEALGGAVELGRAHT